MARDISFGAGNSGISGTTRYLGQGGETNTFGDHDLTVRPILAPGIITEYLYHATSAHQSPPDDDPMNPKPPYKLEIFRLRKDENGIYQEESLDIIEPANGVSQVHAVGKLFDLESLDLIGVRETGLTTVQAQNPTVTLLIKD